MTDFRNDPLTMNNWCQIFAVFDFDQFYLNELKAPGDVKVNVAAVQLIEHYVARCAGTAWVACDVDQLAPKQIDHDDDVVDDDLKGSHEKWALLPMVAMKWLFGWHLLIPKHPYMMVLNSTAIHTILNLLLLCCC